MNKGNIVKEKVILKSFICVVSLCILFVLLNIKLGISNIITQIYFNLSLFITVFLVAVFPFMKYGNWETNCFKKTKDCNVLWKVINEVSDFFSLFIIACCLIQSFFVFGFFRAEVDGDSMEPTFHNTEVVITRSTSNCTNGDVVVVYYDEALNKPYNIHINLATGDLLIKRVVAHSGDTIELKDNVLIINNETEQICYYKTEGMYYSPIPTFDLNNYVGKGLIYNEENNNYIIEKGYYFVMGDNRENSVDSRYIGLFKKNQIVGIVRYRVNSLFDLEGVK